MFALNQRHSVRDVCTDLNQNKRQFTVTYTVLRVPCLIHWYDNSNNVFTGTLNFRYMYGCRRHLLADEEIIMWILQHCQAARR